MIDVEETINAVVADVASRLEAAAEQAVEAAKAGYAAHRRTGKMADAVYAVVYKDQLRIKVISPVFYSAFLEFGTKRQPARYPFQNALTANLPNTLAILEGTQE